MKTFAAFAGVVAYLVALCVTFYCLASLFEKGGVSSNLGNMALAFFGSLMIVGLGAEIIQNFWKKIEEKKRQRELATQLCKHGIKGGETLKRCQICTAEDEARRELAEKLAALKDAAAQFRREEHLRLTKARLRKIEFLTNLSPAQFENAIAALYRQLGYDVEQTSMSNDFGRDAILAKDGKKYLVECKRYGADLLIGRPALQKFYAAMIGDKADGGFFITTSGFAHTAIQYAQETNITCIDGQALSALMMQAYPEDDDSSYWVMCGACGEKVAFDLRVSESEKACSTGHRIINDLDELPISPSLLSEAIPTCPKCGKKMRLVSGRLGQFWGCSGYPQCRSTKPYGGRRGRLRRRFRPQT